MLLSDRGVEREGVFAAFVASNTASLIVLVLVLMPILQILPMLVLVLLVLPMLVLLPIMLQEGERCC